LLARHEDIYATVLDACARLLDWAETVPRSGMQPPYWGNAWWGGLDALVQCSLLVSRDPATYLEVGSGISTAFAHRAIKDFGLRTRIVSIDPEPRADIDVLCDVILRHGLEDVDASVFETIQPGDVVLLDGSHLAVMWADAVVMFLDLLPAIPPGVIVGIDYIFLPVDYDARLVHRLYDEQYLLAAFLLGGASGWELRFPAWFVATGSTLTDRLEQFWPAIESIHRTPKSFWFERVAGEADRCSPQAARATLPSGAHPAAR